MKKILTTGKQSSGFTKAGKRTLKGSVQTRTIAKGLLEDFLKTVGMSEHDAAALNHFAELDESAKITAARKLIEDSIIEATQKPDARLPHAIEASENLLRGY